MMDCQFDAFDDRGFDRQVMQICRTIHVFDLQKNVAGSQQSVDAKAPRTVTILLLSMCLQCHH